MAPKSKASSPAPDSKKRRTGDDVGAEPGVVPAQPPAPPTSAPAGGAPPIPTLPGLDEDPDVLPLMRAVITRVRFDLRNHMASDTGAFAGMADVPLYEHAPLEIKAGDSERDLLSYKPPWKHEEAQRSLASTGLYEASGNLFWVNPFPASARAALLAGETPSCSSVMAMSNAFRPDDAQALAAAGATAREKRILFPVTLVAHASTLGGFSPDSTSFRGTLQLVMGHAVVYGWYVAMQQALCAGDKQWIASLMQAALTVTMRGTVCASTPELARLSIRLSSDASSAAIHLTDTFPAFAKKLQVALEGVHTTPKRLEFCAEHSIRYNGSAVHRTLLIAATTYVDRADDETHALVMRLERKFGRDVLSSKWNNLNKVLQVCAKEYDAAPKMWPGASTPVLIRHVLHFLMWALTHEVITPSSVTLEWLDKGKDGSAGAVARSLAKIQLVIHCRALTDELPEDSGTRKELIGVLEFFESYQVFEVRFGASTPASEDADPYCRARNALSKTGQTVLDFLFDVFSGEHDKAIGACVQKHTGALGLIQWSTLEGDCGKLWSEVARQLGIHKQTISATGGAPPPASGRALHRVLSSCSDAEVTPEEQRRKEIEAERQEAWRDASKVRHKYAQVSLAEFRTEADLQKWFEKQRTAFEFVGKAGQSHRLFVFSADTFGAEADEPWHDTQPTKDLRVILDFMKAQKGSADVLLSLDGRNVTDRKAMAQAFESARNVCDIWIVYEPERRAGRRVAWASDSREMAWLSLPVPRTSIPTKERSKQAAGWAASTHASFYAGVEAVPWVGLPLLKAPDKRKVFGEDELPMPPTKIFDAERGMPLYWAERKPVALWQDLLLCLDASVVVDLSPGSGSCGRACLRSGIQYVAACRTEPHVAWLGNVLDREACELIVTTKSPLFEQDLASMIKRHFAEVLEQLKEQRIAETKEEEDDDGCT